MMLAAVFGEDGERPERRWSRPDGRRRDNVPSGNRQRIWRRSRRSNGGSTLIFV